MAQKPLDPLGMWRDLLNQWEQGLNRLSNETMQSTEAARFMNQAMTLSLRYQQSVTEMVGRYLQAIGVPTRSDLLAIGERLKAMEDRIQQLSAATSPANTGASPAASPAANGVSASAPADAAQSAPAAAELRPPRTKKPTAPPKQDKAG